MNFSPQILDAVTRIAREMLVSGAMSAPVPFEEYREFLWVSLDQSAVHGSTFLEIENKKFYIGILSTRGTQISS